MTLHKIRLLLFLFFFDPFVSYFQKIALFCESSIEGFPIIFMDRSQGQILLYPKANLEDIHKWRCFKGVRRGIPQRITYGTLFKKDEGVWVWNEIVYGPPLSHILCFMINLGTYLKTFSSCVKVWAKMTHESDALKLRSSNLRKFILGLSFP